MKRKRGIFIFLILFILIANLILASDNLKQGIEAYNRGKFNEAIRLINQAFKDNLTTDEKKEANKYIALSQIALGNMNAARDTFTELLLLDPNYKLEEDEVSPKVYQFFLQVKEEKKDIIIAKLADNNYLLAKAYANKENFDKALLTIENIIEGHKIERFRFTFKELETLQFVSNLLKASSRSSTARPISSLVSFDTNHSAPQFLQYILYLLSFEDYMWVFIIDSPLAPTSERGKR